jgi:hypothetical protein
VCSDRSPRPFIGSWREAEAMLQGGKWSPVSGSLQSGCLLGARRLWGGEWKGQTPGGEGEEAWLVDREASRLGMAAG